MTRDESILRPAASRERTNDEWLAGLRSNDAPALETQSDLRTSIRRGLGRTFGARGDLDDAALEDITQDALLRITTKLDRFRGDSRFTTWAMAVAIRVAYTTLRRRRWGDRSLDELGLAVDATSSSVGRASSDPAGPTGRTDLLQALGTAIERDLTPRQRAAILGLLAGMPTAVLAEQLETNANAFYKLYHDARVRLRTALEQRGFDDGDVRRLIDEGSNG